MSQPLSEGRKIIGAYSLAKTIGEGTFGKVKLGYHTSTNEKVAIKILEKKKICDVSDVERVSREIHILKLIRHPNIIQLYEIIETSKRLYLITEYADGGELFDFIVARGKLKETVAVKFYQQLIAGIEYIHKLGVVHRDLKPENLLLDHNTNLKIVDFGLSNTYSSKELLKTACGSPCYAAPEMIAGEKYDGLKADIWSSGVILFAMVCGYLPFEDSNTSKLYKKILAGEYEFPHFISDLAKDLISKILDVSPDTRYSIEDIRNHEWFKLCQQDLYPGILIGNDDIIVDHSILKQLQTFKYDVKHAKGCIEANKHNSTTAAYYLLLKRHIVNGGRSVADYAQVNSPETSPIRSKNMNKVMPHTMRPPMINLSNEPSFNLTYRQITPAFDNNKLRRRRESALDLRNKLRASVSPKALSRNQRGSSRQRYFKSSLKKDRHMLRNVRVSPKSRIKYSRLSMI